MDTDQPIREVRDAAHRVDASLKAVDEARRALHRTALRALMVTQGDDELAGQPRPGPRLGRTSAAGAHVEVVVGGHRA